MTNSDLQKMEVATDVNPHVMLKTPVYTNTTTNMIYTHVLNVRVVVKLLSMDSISSALYPVIL